MLSRLSSLVFDLLIGWDMCDDIEREMVILGFVNINICKLDLLE